MNARATTSFRGEERRQEFHTDVRFAREMHTLRQASVEQEEKEFLVLDGYASTVEQGYTMYDMFGAYSEIIDRGAFDATLAANPDVNFLINHAGLSMARTTVGTLELSADDQGLRSIAYLNPQRSDVRDLELALRDGALDQMSFAFRIEDGQWSPDYSEYRITKVNLDRGDVSAVNFGANPYTSISARAKQGFDAVEHLEGEPLRMLAARAQARLAETAPHISFLSGGSISVASGGSISVGNTPAKAHEVKSGPNIRTLRARLALEER